MPLCWVSFASKLAFFCSYIGMLCVLVSVVCLQCVCRVSIYWHADDSSLLLAVLSRIIC